MAKSNRKAAPRKSTSATKRAGAPRKSTTKSKSSTADKKDGDGGDWREVTLARICNLMREADPEMIEERKWKKPTNPAGVPVFSHDGIVCTGETYKNVVKITFAKGASIPDPSLLFNSSLEGNRRRAIDIHEGEKVDARAFKALVKAAVAHNAPATRQGKLTKLLSGGNPQIAKADGNSPVQAYIAAMPGWKREVGKQLDAIIMRNAPDVKKAVKWNSPFYGIEGQGWFLSFHVFTRYVKVTFFAATSLRPVPPGGTPKSKDARWIDIHENDKLDETQMAKWIKQAAALPGWKP